jgi:glucose/arabinose dehydrogenase
VKTPRRLAVVAIATMLAACGGGTSNALTNLGSGLRGVAGVRASLYATAPKNVAAFAFDTQQRLWLATADYTDHGKDGVYLVTKKGASPLEVIPALHTPLGLLWRGDTLYVASNERVDAYRGFNGTRFTNRTAIVTFPSGVGEVNGLIATPAGRILVGITAPCDHCTPSSPWSAAIVSFRPDGSEKRVLVKRIRAPINGAFFPGTTDLFVTLNHRDDLGAKTPGDWLVRVDDGDDFRFPACYGQDGTVCAGVPKPVAVLDPHAAVSGLAIVNGQLGAKVGTAAIVAEWATGTVKLVRLTKHGSSYAGTVSTFAAGLKNPVPVVLTPKRTVLVGDWGTGRIYEFRALH